MSVVAIVGTSTAISAKGMQLFPTVTGYGTGSIPPITTAGSYGTGSSESLLLSTRLLISTGGVSSVSSELASLMFVILSWKGNPTILRSDTLDNIKPINSDLEDLISKPGIASSSSECGSERERRGILGAIGNMVSKLSCIDEDLDSITKSINTDDVDVFDDSINAWVSLIAWNQESQLGNTIAYGSYRLGFLQHSDEDRTWTSTNSCQARSRSFYNCTILI